MDTDQQHDERDESWEPAGVYVVPSSKVRLPDDLTKLRKRTRRDATSRDDEQEV